MEPATPPAVKKRSFIMVCIVLVITALADRAAAARSAHPVPAWRQAVASRSWNFPRDHGAHPGYRTEWWYFTGNLQAEQNRRYGYQLTFFRQGIAPVLKTQANLWSIRDIYPAHFALSDIGNNSFRYAEQISRAGPGLAGAETGGLKVWCLQWSAHLAGGKIFLAAQREGMEITLELAVRKPPVLHGEQGLSKKGTQAGNASYYYSLTDLPTKGSLRTGPAGLAFPVAGTSWFDHEFGSHQLSRDLAGWDWFGLHLADGRSLMLYFLRKTEGSLEEASSGTLVERTGQTRHLRLSDIRIDVLSRWKSPKSGARYPNRWRIRVPSAGIDLTVATLIADQELDTAGSTGIVYYEGALGGQGMSAGRPVICEGYGEMTGYAGSMGGTI